MLDFQCGPLKVVHLVKNRAGKSKGFVYMYVVKLIFIFIFKSRIEPTIDLKSSAKEAVMKLDDYQLGFKRLKVAISNPPKRERETHTHTHTHTFSYLLEELL